MKTFADFLFWVSVGGSATLTAVLASWAAEYWPWFQKQAPVAKRLLMILVCAGLTLGAWAILTFVPADVLAAISVPVMLVYTAITVLLNQQAAFAAKKAIVAATKTDLNDTL